MSQFVCDLCGGTDAVAAPPVTLRVRTFLPKSEDLLAVPLFKQLCALTRAHLTSTGIFQPELGKPSGISSLKYPIPSWSIENDNMA